MDPIRAYAREGSRRHCHRSNKGIHYFIAVASAFPTLLTPYPIPRRIIPASFLTRGLVLLLPLPLLGRFNPLPARLSVRRIASSPFVPPPLHQPGLVAPRPLPVSAAGPVSGVGALGLFPAVAAPIAVMLWLSVARARCLSRALGRSLGAVRQVLPKGRQGGGRRATGTRGAAAGRLAPRATGRRGASDAGAAGRVAGREGGRQSFQTVALPPTHRWSKAPKGCWSQAGRGCLLIAAQPEEQRPFPRCLVSSCGRAVWSYERRVEAWDGYKLESGQEPAWREGGSEGWSPGDSPALPKDVSCRNARVFIRAKVVASETNGTVP